MALRRILIITLNVILVMLMIALVALAIYGYVKYNSIKVMVGSYYTVAFGILIGVAAIVILLALCAICLSDSDSYCCCAIYCILALAMGLAFIGVGIATYKAPKIILGENCTSSSYFQDAQTFSEAAQNSICFTCACYFPLSVIQQTYTTAQIAELTPQIPLANSVDSSLPVRAQQCTGWNSASLDDGYNIFSTLESHFQCTGWCPNTTSLFYRFTNVSNGIPQNTCYNALVQTTDNAARVIGIPAIIIGGLNLLSALAFMFICCTCTTRGQKLQNTITGPTTYELNRMPQLTAQTLNTPHYFQTNSFNPDGYSMNQRSYF